MVFKMKKIKYDKLRYKNGNGKIPLFLLFYRKYNESNNFIFKKIYKILWSVSKVLYLCELPLETQIGEGLYIGHPYSITINGKCIIGKNCNIYKGVTIGQENRGKRKGTPNIGNNVYIGANSSIVGKIFIGDNVLIAPNTFVNCDVPSNSVVFGNPCIIKEDKDATKGYIDYTC